MISQETINNQLKQLQAHRQTLAVYLQQQARMGEAHSPPVVLNGIAETRAHIQLIKSRLQAIGIAVPEDFNDDEPQIVPVASPVLRRTRSRLIIGVMGAALLLTIGLMLRLFGGIWVAPVSGAPASGTTPSGAVAPGATLQILPPYTPTTVLPEGQNSLDKLTTVDEIEPLLVLANIPLAHPEDEKRTRDYFISTNSAYRALAIAVLKVVGQRRLHQPIFLDQIDKWYTQMSGTGYAKRGPLDLEKVKQAMLKANNDYYTENADSLDALLEPGN